MSFCTLEILYPFWEQMPHSTQGAPKSQPCWVAHTGIGIVGGGGVLWGAAGDKRADIRKTLKLKMGLLKEQIRTVIKIKFRLTPEIPKVLLLILFNVTSYSVQVNFTSFNFFGCCGFMQKNDD